MIEETEVQKIKDGVEELLQKMTLAVLGVEIESSVVKNKESLGDKDVVDINISIEEPQVLIGQNGQTLFELTRLLRIILSKKLKKDFYLNVDINDYKKKKIEYLKDLATTLADQVARAGETKVLPPMPSYERRIIHAELSGRQDVITESQGEGVDRHMVIRLK